MNKIVGEAEVAAVDLTDRLAPLFFFSGLAALVYQVCWQRLLFASFGVDLESITIVVSAFMLGLGLGALAGGLLADWLPGRTVFLFAVSETLIGLFGWFSPDVIRSSGELFVQGSPIKIALVNFLILLIPTSLMGATLPILVSHVTRRWKNVGASIGYLYQVNTLGAAIGVLIIGFLWFLLFDLNTAVRTAAVVNLCISAYTFTKLKSNG